ncbi:MAG TPA: MBL fold metallo-hydrolase [Acidimicrobiales bacterium]|nr:MBL fold metallo-hydrolase [Acidimicrobiales bacterium]
MAAVTAAASSLTVTVLGCSGSFPGPGSACSGYLVQGAGATLWLDAGSGTMANLQRHVDLDQVDAVVLSHEHPDHWSDVEGYRVALAYAIERSGFPVYAPEGVRRLLSTDPGPTFDWRTVSDGDQVEVGGLRLRFSRTDHPPETLAVRIDGDGRSLGYSADTGRGWSFEALGAGIDLALCEATYVGESDVPGHLTAAEAATMAAQCRVGHLVLTHLFPTVDPERTRAEAEAAYGGPVDVARLHEEYQV